MSLANLRGARAYKNRRLGTGKAAPITTDEQGCAAWFKQATGQALYPFQTRFACESPLPQLVDVLTGME